MIINVYRWNSNSFLYVCTTYLCCAHLTPFVPLGNQLQTSCNRLRTYHEVIKVCQLAGGVFERQLRVVCGGNAATIVRHLDQLAAILLQPHLRQQSGSNGLTR